MMSGNTFKVAALVTEYRPGSHADVLLTKYLKGFPLDEGYFAPRTELVALYLDQHPANDIGYALAKEHGVTIYDTITQCLTLGGDTGGNEPKPGGIAVDGVIIIGEHGDYAWNEKDQHLYPRKYFMEAVCGVMATSGRAVPIFCDKHLSYNWHDAKWMVDRAKELGAPFMAGSSLVLAWRKPWLEHPLGTIIEEAVAIGYSGLDIYGFHALEALQCMVERRSGGEVGIAAVQCLEGDAVWEAASTGRWSMTLAEAACDCIENKPDGGMVANTPQPAVFLIEYRDGFNAAVLMLEGYVKSQAYAAATAPDGSNGAVEIVACAMNLHEGVPYGDKPYRPAEGTFAHFAYLGRNVEEMILTGQPTYPVERCLLTTGTLEAVLTSRHQGHARLVTPHLDVAYTSFPDSEPGMGTSPPGSLIRPRSQEPCGASLMDWPPTREQQAAAARL